MSEFIAERVLSQIEQYASKVVIDNLFQLSSDSEK